MENIQSVKKKYYFANRIGTNVNTLKELTDKYIMSSKSSNNYQWIGYVLM